jgi:hypothetical protein
MQCLDENSAVCFNFINSLDSDTTKKSHKFCLLKFLNDCKIDLAFFLKLPQQDISNLVIKYLVEKNISREYKNLIVSIIISRTLYSTNTLNELHTEISK